MKLFNRKHFKIGLLFLLFIALFCYSARAADTDGGGIVGSVITSFGTAAIAKIAFVINYLIGVIAGVLFQIGGALINLALKLNGNILNSDTNVFLYTGWNIILNLADLALILALIVIAFATILHFESYGMKQTLWRLIVVALLINFSLVIPGIFIDTGNYLTQFLSDKITQNNVLDMGAVIAGSFHAQSMLNAKDCVSNGQVFGNAFSVFSNNTISAIASVAFTTIFTGTAAIVLLAVFAMLIIRYISLSVILMFSPLLMVAWIFPDTKKHFSKYVSEFFRWIFFAPASLFFIYLSVLALQIQNKGKGFAENFFGVGVGAANQTICKSLSFGMDTIGQMIMAIGLLSTSLIVANSFSLTGGKQVFGWAEKTSGNFRNWTQRKAIQAGTSITTRTKMGQKAISWMQNAGIKSDSWLGRKIGYPARKAGLGMQKLGMGQANALIKQAAERQKGLSHDDLALRYADMFADEKVAALEKLEKDGKLDKLVKKYPQFEKDIADGSVEKMLAKYGKHGPENTEFFNKIENGIGKSKEMMSISQSLKTAPDHEHFKLLGQLEDESKKFAGRIDLNKLSPKSLTDPTFGGYIAEVLLTKNPAALSKIAPKAKDLDELKVLSKTIREAGDKITKEFSGKLMLLVKGSRKLSDIEKGELEALRNQGKDREVVNILKQKDPDIYDEIASQKHIVNLDKIIDRNLAGRLYGAPPKDEEKKEEKKEENKEDKK